MARQSRARNLATDPDFAFRNLSDEAQYKYLLLDSPMAEELFCKHYLDLELDPYEVFSMKLIRGRFHTEEEVYAFIRDQQMDWMFENGGITHGNNAGVSPYYWEKPNVLILWPAGFGKALALDTPIATPTGWTTMRELRVGDEVFDERGVAVPVTYVSEIHRGKEVYAVSSNGSEPVVADADHLWTVQLDHRKPPKVHTTKDLAKDRRRRPIVPVALPLITAPVVLPLDPYVLGVWLGDGHSANGRISQSKDDAAWMRPEIERRGFETKDHADPINFGVKGLAAPLRSIGVLGNKHIPDVYLRSSISQRLDLLNGLIDTDGSVDKRGSVEFCSVNKRLATGVLELVRSLGVKAHFYEDRATIKGRDCGPRYRVYFFMKDAALMPRKRIRCKNAEKYTEHYLNVERCGYADTVCIQVASPSSLFLAGRALIPTHNTTIVSTRAVPIMEICDNPNSRNQFIGKNETEAFSFSTTIRRELQNPRLEKDFGCFKPTDKAVPYANQSFSVEQRQYRDVRENFEFYGSNSHAELGKRSDRVCIDDVETPDTARTPDMRDKLLEWMRIGPLTSARPIWNRGTLGEVKIPQSIKWSKTARYWSTAIVGTIFHPEAFYAMVRRDPTFTCVKFDCFKDKKCTISLSDKMLDVKALERERRSIGVLAFNKRYRNIAYNEEEMAFREAWVRGQEEEINGQRISHVGCLDGSRSYADVDPDWDVYVGFDPASGSRSRWSAYAAYVILGKSRNDDDNNIYLIDHLKLQDNFDRMLDHLLEGNEAYGIEGFLAKYDYKVATVEKNAFGKWIIDNDRMKPYTRCVPPKVMPSYTGTNKTDPEAGVFAMGQMIQDGRFRIPYQESSDQEKAESFIGELLMYPKGTCDLVMAMWLATQNMKLQRNEYRSTAGAGSKVKWYHNPSAR